MCVWGGWGCTVPFSPQDVVLTVLQLGTGILADAEEGEQVLIPDPIIRMGQACALACILAIAPLPCSGFFSRSVAPCPLVVRVSLPRFF